MFFDASVPGIRTINQSIDCNCFLIAEIVFWCFSTWDCQEKPVEIHIRLTIDHPPNKKRGEAHPARPHTQLRRSDDGYWTWPRAVPFFSWTICFVTHQNCAKPLHATSVEPPCAGSSCFIVPSHENHSYGTSSTATNHTHTHTQPQTTHTHTNHTHTESHNPINVNPTSESTREKSKTGTRNSGSHIEPWNSPRRPSALSLLADLTLYCACM